ncbi:DNA cytosine methyltransferase [Pseudomonas azerbaijanoccidentalis]|nr:DNA cytosine methyltransferase [Pseudomonas azerbaijanoccidentalis]
MSKPAVLPPIVSYAPEHAAVGVDDRELSEIVACFNEAQRQMNSVEERVHHLFDAPRAGEVVRLNDKATVYQKDHGWMTPDEARQRVEAWSDHCAAQGLIGTNADKVVLSLFDKSGAWSRPWEEAGYQVYRFDIQENPETGDVNKFSVDFFGDWFGDFDGLDIYAILAACPCTDFAVSGARHFAAKDADGRTVASVELVHQTLRVIEYFRPVLWAIENPVGRIERLGGLPPWRLSFDPFHVGDTYTKKTLIWGRFNADLPVAPVDPVEGSKMHRMYGGSSLATKNARSVTPEGFAYAFFMANNAVDHPQMAISGKYDRLCSRLISEAVKCGLTADEVDNLVEDAYYMDLNDEAAEQLLRDELTARGAALHSYADTGGQFAMWL